jgi:hypothetical protein
VVTSSTSLSWSVAATSPQIRKQVSRSLARCVAARNAQGFGLALGFDLAYQPVRPPRHEIRYQKSAAQKSFPWTSEGFRCPFVDHASPSLGSSDGDASIRDHSFQAPPTPIQNRAPCPSSISVRTRHVRSLPSFVLGSKTDRTT